MNTNSLNNSLPSQQQKKARYELNEGNLFLNYYFLNYKTTFYLNFINTLRRSTILFCQMVDRKRQIRHYAYVISCKMYRIFIGIKT
jgi:hypothetical protein